MKTTNDYPLRTQSDAASAIAAICVLVLLVAGMYFIGELIVGARQSVQSIVSYYRCYSYIARCVNGLPIPGR